MGSAGAWAPQEHERRMPRLVRLSADASVFQKVPGIFSNLNATRIVGGRNQNIPIFRRARVLGQRNNSGGHRRVVRETFSHVGRVASGFSGMFRENYFSWSEKSHLSEGGGGWGLLACVRRHGGTESGFRHEADLLCSEMEAQRAGADKGRRGVAIGGGLGGAGGTARVES